MGEAKRRKQIDPNYGKPKQVSLGICVSERTGNFIVYCKHCNFWIDSAFKYEDALLVKKSVEEVTSINPPSRFNFDGWIDWLSKHWKDMPVVDAKSYTLDLYSGEVKEETFFSQIGITPPVI